MAILSRLVAPFFLFQLSAGFVLRPVQVTNHGSNVEHASILPTRQIHSPPIPPNKRTRSYATELHVTSSSVDDLLQKLRSRSVRDLKKECNDRRIPSNDVFEKEQLVQRLYDALKTTTQPSVENGASSSQAATTNGASSKTTNHNPSVIETPLELLSLRGSVDVNDPEVPPGLKFRPSDQPFATMDLEVADGQTLKLMVDTACSGVVLQPSAVAKYGLKWITDTSMTSTGAGGTAEPTGVTQLDTFQVGGHTFGPLPAAVQTVESLPETIEGIIGLSFLGQFHTVEFDYQHEVLRLYLDVPPAPPSEKVMTTGNLKLLGSMGIYVTDVYLGGRGPVSMIVDTGGSNTFLSWKGVADLGLSRDQVSPIVEPMGAMGNTGQVFDLTHRVFVSSQLQLKSRTASGLPLGGNARLGIDIGNIPILTNQNMGGILGLDVFTRCSAIRVQLKGRVRSLTLLA